MGAIEWVILQTTHRNKKKWNVSYLLRSIAKRHMDFYLLAVATSAIRLYSRCYYFAMVIAVMIGSVSIGLGNGLGGVKLNQPIQIMPGFL